MSTRYQAFYLFLTGRLYSKNGSFSEQKQVSVTAYGSLEINLFWIVI